MRRGFLLWALLGLAALMAGCQTAPSESPVAVAPDPLAQAREAMERGDHKEAAGLLRQALASEPDSLEARYRLAVSLSHLNQTDEAIRQFRWVMAHGPSDSPEARAARQWLVLVGALAEEAPGESGSATEAAQQPLRTPATVTGRAIWAEDGPATVVPRLQLFLKGVPGSPVRDEYYVLRTDGDGGFRFTNVVPGEYVLIGGFAGRPTWRLRVQVNAGQNVTLDLTPENSVKNRDDFPETSAGASVQAGPNS